MAQVRFNLRWLLLGIALFAALAWWLARTGITVAHVVVVDNRLALNDDGTIDGQLQCRMVEANEGTFKYSEFVCILYHVDRPGLVDLKNGQQARIAYRSYDAWWVLPREDPYIKFLNQQLHVPDELILGAVRRDGWMEVVVRGKNDSPK